MAAPARIEASGDALRLLVVEDNAADVTLMRRALAEMDTPVELFHVDDAEQALTFLRREPPFADTPLPDAALLDLTLPRMTGLELLERMKKMPGILSLPVIILTSSRYPRDLARAYALQAAACFVKPMTGYRPLLERIVSFLSSATLPPESAELSGVSAQAASAGGDDAFFAALVESAVDAIAGLDGAGRIRSWNRAAEGLYGRSAEGLQGRHIVDIVSEDQREPILEAFQETLEGHETRSIETWQHLEGRQREVSWRFSPIRGPGGSMLGVSLVARDVTEANQIERQFRLAVESSPSGMVMVDVEGRILLVNAEAERLFGWDRGELVGQPIEMLVPERFRGVHPSERRGYVANPETRAMGAGRELYGLRKDGTEFPVEIGLNPIETGDGTVVLSSVVDITERKQAEERFRLAVEASPSGIIMVDGSGRITLANAETHRMFGYDRGELEGTSVDALVPDRFRAGHEAHRRGFAAQPEARAMGSGRELFGCRKDGTELPVEIGLNPIETSTGTMVLSTIVDITERKQVIEALTHQAQELARSNSDLEQFAYVASHDLQEPLRTVSGFTQLLAERYADALDDEANEFIELAQNGALRMARLLDDLLAYSRVTTRGKKPSPVEPTKCVQEARANLAVAIDEAHATVVVDEPMPAVLADAAQLTMLFQNLIGNAIKFRREEPVKIEVWGERRGRAVTLSVRDNGIGIPSEHRDRIFDVFERLHTQDRYPGTGIGLALCKRIVERHGGAISVRSDGETGTTFFFTLEAASPGATS